MVRHVAVRQLRLVRHATPRRLTLRPRPRARRAATHGAVPSVMAHYHATHAVHARQTVLAIAAVAALFAAVAGTVAFVAAAY